MRTFLEKLRGLREDNDLTQSQIARVLGTSQTMYARYERGANEMPIPTWSPSAATTMSPRTIFWAQPRIPVAGRSTYNRPLTFENRKTIMALRFS